MQKFTALYGFCLLLSLSVFSQSISRIDSLETLLKSLPEDSSKVILLDKLAHEYSLSNTDKALLYGLSGVQLAKKIQFEKGKAACLNKVGLIYNYRGVYDKALQYYLESLKINEELGNRTGVSDNLCNLGAVFRVQKKYKDALAYQHRALKIDKEIGNKSHIAGDQTNIGNTYYDSGNYSMAIRYYNEALKTYRVLADHQNAATVLNNIGAIYFSQNEFDKALENFGNALKIFEEKNDKLGIAIDLNNVGQVYLNKEEYRKAKDYCLKSLEIATNIDAMDIQQINYENLATIAEKTRMYKEAYEYLKLSAALSNKLLNEETSRQISELSIKYETEKKEKENILLKEQTSGLHFLNNRQKTTANYLIAGLIIIAGIGFVFYKRSRNKQRANQNLEKIVQERTAELQAKNKQKELMLQEIHHRVKNNLQLITSMLRLQRHFKGSKNVDEILDVCTDRIKCMAILHDKLYQSTDFSEINAEDYFTELSEYVSQNYDPKTRIDLDIIPLKLHIDKLIPCGLILNELVSNAHKYAFRSGEKNNQIDISFTRNNNGRLFHLKIKDNGAGLPEKFDLNNQSGLGLTIVHSLVEQLDGQIELMNKEGVLVDISFPAV